MTILGDNTQRRCSLCAWATREKHVRVMRARCGVLFTPSVAYKGNRHSCTRKTLFFFLKKINYWRSSHFEDQVCHFLCLSWNGLCRVWWLSRSGRLIGCSSCCWKFLIVFTAIFSFDHQCYRALRARSKWQCKTYLHLLFGPMSASVFCPPNCHLRLAVCVLLLESLKKRHGFFAVSFPQRHLRLMVFRLVISLTLSCTAIWSFLSDKVWCGQWVTFLFC